MPVMVIIALLSLALSGNAWAIRSDSTAWPTATHTTDGDGKYARCIKRAKELNGLCQQYEIRK
jgi:hypothetical protein